MKDCEKILNEMYWRMKVMVEENENGRDDLDEYGLNDEVWNFYGYGVFEELMEEWYYENDLGVGCGEKWGRDYREVLLDFIEFIGMSVFIENSLDLFDQGFTLFCHFDHSLEVIYSYFVNCFHDYKNGICLAL